MSVSASSRSLVLSIFTPQELTLELEWLKIRDLLVGENIVSQDIARALELAAACHHRDAVYLTEIFAGKDVNTKEEAREVFLAHEPDPRALCFAALVYRRPGDEDRLRRAAEMGFAFAQAHVDWRGFRSTDEERLSLCLRASLQGERDGFYSLGCCYQHGVGCVQDVIKAKENYLLAAKLNHVQAMDRYGILLDDKDPQRWHWWGRAAARGNPTAFFLDRFGSVVDLFDSDPSLAPAVFMIGRMLRGHINAEKGEIFGQSFKFASRIGPANRAVAFFSFQCAAARASVDMWCLMARRINGKVNRDIRKKIGMLIWEARELGNYKENSANEAISESEGQRPS